MRTVVIDNIDSFVYNLVQYVGLLGGNPAVVENTADIGEVRELVEEEEVTHIILSPGPGRPEDAGVTNEVIKEYKEIIPLLGVCLGHQCIAHVYGAKVVRAGKLMHGKTSQIRYEGNSIMEGMDNPMKATRYHSLVVDRESIPPELEVFAYSLDDGEVMGLRHKKYPVYGLQFHPESILTKNGIRIIKNFLEIK
ncbi:MAG: anthranilate/aminodeoxychorismate synthase component II [Candidatus Altiarchaeales archaeon ex4484_2]|nr:MAG: anthranilate/aminodeoxychorismate synthase component II [Candidatus Altiarchaeales archaeon ex4484_2]